MSRRSVTASLLVALVLAAAAPVHAAEPGEDLTVHVLTFGPGDHPFFKFGHNAIWVQPQQGQGLVYNFGTFNFDSPALIPKFLRGRLTYWLSVGPADETLYSYQASNRTIEAQELDLTPPQRWTLYQNLRENARPEKREYLYDYFWDNCSTRVRDAVDLVAGGRVKEAGQGPATMSFRQHALRMTADMFWVYAGLHLGLGTPTDERVDVWREAFLPERLRDLLRITKVSRDGTERPLVKAERVLFQAQRAPLLARPPSWVAHFAGVGLVLGGVLALLGVLGGRRRGARVVLGTLVAVLGFTAGLLGLILAALWAFTNHKAAHANANILLLAPFAIALVVYGVGVARGRERAYRKAYLVALGALVFAAVGVAAKVLPGGGQDNTAFIALMVPLWAGMALGLKRLAPTLRRRPARSAR